MSQQWFECVCQFFAQQSASINGILVNLGNQNTISDIATGDQLQIPSGASQVLPQASPMTLFMILLFMIWGYMFIFSRNKKAETEKPKWNGPDDSNSGPDSGPPDNGTVS